MNATRPINWPLPTGAALHDDIDNHLAHARRLRARALGQGGRRIGRALRRMRRALAAGLNRWAAERSLALLSDRSLADIGIPRHAIRDVLRGDRQQADAGEPARLRPIADRFDLWRERSKRRRRLVRELEAYSDRDLEELGLFRADIPRVALAAA